MFSYYGSKSKIINRYPAPTKNTIIEPFCGSARYALLYPDKQVILNDKYRLIYDIWDYLVKASPAEIDMIPEMQAGQDLRDLNLPQNLANILYFMVNRGVPRPHYLYSKWAYSSKEISKVKRRIHSFLPKIRHWQVSNISYELLPDIEATWFIDPPYQYGGNRYIHNTIDYAKLADWCKTRKGQVIVCENSKADWLPFAPLVKLQGQRSTTIESVWIRE